MSAEGGAARADPQRTLSRDRWLLLLVAEAAILLIVLAATGALSGVLSLDTQSYLPAIPLAVAIALATGLHT